MTVILISVAVATLLAVIYAIYCALRPCNRIRKLGDLGLLLGDPELKGVYRERQITRLAKLRRIGELPPVYPNGWYCIAETDELKPKAVKEITVFGQFLTLIRSESGQVHLIDSYCPHLGANFNVGGKLGPGIVHMLFDFGALGRGVVVQHVTPQEPLQQLVRFKLYSTIPRWFAKFFLISEATQVVLTILQGEQSTIAAQR
ncbi:rieske [2Fe-2S] domain protein [Teladorsagia circumcincta]|uniref:Rieske [2Fe-2S] domain protein n=1 Tax=Teladorsagia circumcincta TaxID=45464 RepID=A0A2G9U742_TELCI|nr:rieske [2Fe-2S] domain protein [Teladorsagia circumcincta]